MKKKLLFKSLFLFFAIQIVITSGCKKTKIPKVTTSEVSKIEQSKAVCGGNVIENYGEVITSCGVCWSISESPTILDFHTVETMSSNFESKMTGLASSTTYYLRAYATSKNGTGYGNTVSFTTAPYGILFNPNLTYGTVSDIDGNVYKTITIGNQTWMAENLKVTRYRNGDSIPNIIGCRPWQTLPSSYNWDSITSGAYCIYDDYPAFYSIYGNLYNWYAVNDPRGLCPVGWHIPTFAEWNILADYLGGASVAVNKMKECGTEHWSGSNYAATNESGFSALPGGYRHRTDYEKWSSEAYWWSSSGFNDTLAYCSVIPGSGNELYLYYSFKNSGFSVRCIKD